MRARTVAATVAGLCASGVAQHPVQLHEDAMRGVPKKVYSSSGCSSCESVDARCGRGASGGAIQPCRLVGARAGPAGGEERTSSRVIRLMVCRTEGMLGGDACRACRQRYQK